MGGAHSTRLRLPPLPLRGPRPCWASAVTRDADKTTARVAGMPQGGAAPRPCRELARWRGRPGREGPGGPGGDCGHFTATRQG